MPSILETAERSFTVEEWLEWEKNSDTRHEYHYGKLIPMAGEAKKANKIAKNLVNCSTTTSTKKVSRSSTTM